MIDVVVTGATGFVGAHVVEALRGRPVRVRAIVRATSNTARLRELGVQTSVVALDDPAGLRTALEGADVVVHLAALTHARTEAELLRVNGDGTSALLAECTKRVRERPGGSGLRFVYLSSLAAVGPAVDGRAVDASTPPRPLTAYGRSKLAGEVAIRAAAAAPAAVEGVGVEGVILRAPAVYGPGDRELLRFFRLARVGIMPIPAGPERLLQMVHVKDLARGIADAATAPSVSGLFHIADPQAYRLEELYGLVAGAVGGRPPLFLPVPGGVINAAAALSELGAGLARRSTMFSREKVRELLAPGWLCETSAATAAFGFTAEIPLEQGLRDTAEWYRIHGWL